MAHELTQRDDGFVEMAYVGQKPWHRLGQELTIDAPLEVWEKQAGFDWSAERSIVEYKNKDGLLLPYSSKHVIYRSDNMHPVGLVSDRYIVVQPKQMLGMFRDLIEHDGWYIHTAGTLRGGSKLWVMASHPELQKGSIGKHEKINAHLLAATSLDGSMKTIGKLVSETVVCANTLRVALGEDGEEIRMSHRSEFDAEEMKECLGVSVYSFEQFVKHANELAEKAVGTEQAMHVLRSLFGQPTIKDIKPSAPDFEFQKLMAQVSKLPGKQREQRSVARCMALFEGQGIGASLPGRVGTAWGLLSACTQHIDHELGRTDDGRMDSAWFGRGEQLKQRAVEELAG